MRETHLRPEEFVYPLFIREGSNVREPVGSMPGVYQLSSDEAAREAEECLALGVRSVLLFGIPSDKDEQGSGAWAEVRSSSTRFAVKARYPELLVVTDVCLCEYTSHGHCGVLRGDDVDNDLSLDLLARTAVSHVEAGADVVAPSNMMDGTVGSIRRALDAAGRSASPILAYSTKYASAFYGPFREAAESTPAFGDRRSYQMDPANRREALREVELDVEEGADMVMVKPALAYLDVISDVRAATGLPVAAYNVSGEYA
ncbi:MAG: porphobilinogen synthase, partial [Chloroflexia bacterium]